MFVITELEDRLEIRAAVENRHKAIETELRNKYCNHLVDELGIGMSLHQICQIKEYGIKGTMLITDVVFQILFYRFYADEVCVGKILRQTEEGIIVEDEFFKQYEVQACDLPENSEYIVQGTKSNWVWNYKGSQLVFYVGDTVRFRTKELCFEDFLVTAAMNEQGLGPCSWWD